jgi:type IV secretory pathway TraG/TraD family ATPase VirD4
MTDSGRLRRPMLFALDEVTQICPVDLPTWMADSGGKGIQIIAVAHGVAQMRRRWGADGARVILDTAGTNIVLPGVKDPDTLKALSTTAGSVSMREHGQEHTTEHDIMTPAMIRGLPNGYALVIRDNRPPVISRMFRVWDDREHKTAKTQPLPGMWGAQAPGSFQASLPPLSAAASAKPARPRPQRVAEDRAPEQASATRDPQPKVSSFPWNRAQEAASDGI